LIATAFHQTASIRKMYTPGVAIEKFTALSTIDFSSNYHEGFGDLFMQMGNFKDAGFHYAQSLRTTSRPNVLGKYGWCLVKLKYYDSASYYFKTIEKLQPHKYAPRLALLKLYEEKKDTALIKIKAREIMAMPVKVPSREVEKIKAEAIRWLQS